MPDFSTFEELRSRRNVFKKDQESAQARFREHVGREAAELRLSAPWRVWESHVRALLDSDEAQLARHLERLQDVEVAEDVVWLLHRRILVLRGRIEARREDLSLPEELERRGQAGGENP